MPDPVIQAAIERGATVTKAIIQHRDALFPACEALLLIAGPDGLRACMAGVVESVIAAKTTRKNTPQAEGGAP